MTVYCVASPFDAIITFANVVGRMLCIQQDYPVCLFVCLSVCDDPDSDYPNSGSGFRIQNIIFLQSLCCRRPHRVCFYMFHMLIRNEVSLCVERHTMESADISITLCDTQQWKVMMSACHCLTHNNGKC